MINPHLTLFIGRLLIAALFIGGAVQKSLGPTQVMSLLAGWGMPQVLVWPALGLNALAGLMLVIGVGVRPVAYILAAYCAFTSIFHYIPTDPWQMSIFVKNWAIAGGCLCLAVAGSGKFAIRQDTGFTFFPRPR